MVKKQSRMVKKQGKTGSKPSTKTRAKLRRKENLTGVSELSGPVSIEETATLPLDLPSGPEKTLDSEVEKPGNSVSEASVKTEAVAGMPVEKKISDPHLLIKSDEKIEFLGFLMNLEEYAIPVSQIKEIIRPAEMTVIPGSSPILLGITSLRGVIIPVFKLSNRLANLKVSGETRSGGEENEKLKRIVIIQIDQGIFGLMVDGVTDVIKIKEEEIQPPPSLLNQMGQEMIKGITRFKNRLVILLFIERIVDVIQDEMKKIRKT